MMLKPYKGYEGVVTFVDPEADLITGEVVNIQDGANFQGRTPGELQKAFEESVDFYLERCAREGRDPDRPFSGQVMLRMDPELHKALHRAARLSGLSLNAWAKDALSAAAANPAVKSGEFYTVAELEASKAVSGKRQVSARHDASGRARSTSMHETKAEAMAAARKAATKSNTAKQAEPSKPRSASAAASRKLAGQA